MKTWGRHLSSDGIVELVGQTEARQAQLHPLGLLEGDSHIYTLFFG
jgi:hypothetical protein